MDKDPNQYRAWLTTTIIVFTLIGLVFLGVNSWLDHATNTLSWGSQKASIVTFSGAALLWACLLLLGLRRLFDTKKEADLAVKLNLIFQPLGWSLLALSWTFSAARAEWHAPRELFFGLAILGCGLLGASYLVPLTKKLNVKEKKEDDKIGICLEIVSAMVWSLLFCMLLWKYFLGSPSEGL